MSSENTSASLEEVNSGTQEENFVKVASSDDTRISYNSEPMSQEADGDESDSKTRSTENKSMFNEISTEGNGIDSMDRSLIGKSKTEDTENNTKDEGSDREDCNVLDSNTGKSYKKESDVSDNEIEGSDSKESNISDSIIEGGNSKEINVSESKTEESDRKASNVSEINDDLQKSTFQHTRSGSEGVNGSLTSVCDISIDESCQLEVTNPISNDRKRKHSDTSEDDVTNVTKSDSDDSEKIEDTSPPRKFPKNCSGNFVYRLLRESENDNSDIHAKDPSSNETVEDHVGSGSRQGFTSQFISTCRTYDAVRELLSIKRKGLSHVRIIKIDLDKVTGQIIDLTDETIRNRYLPGVRAKGYAIRFKEILIKGSIRRSAYEVIYSGDKYSAPCSEP